MLKYLIEALLFASGHGVSLDELYVHFAAEHTIGEIEYALRQLKEQYCAPQGIILIEYNRNFQFQSNPAYGAVVADMLQITRERELSKTLLQVLAIVAYKQPITKQEIEELRGDTSADYAISMLLRHNLIEPVGRKEAVGRPILYGTTDEFLKKFGMKDAKNLPDLESILLSIKNNADKYFKRGSELYGGAGDEIAAAKAGEAAYEDDDDGDELPDFLRDTEIVEIN